MKKLLILITFLIVSNAIQAQGWVAHILNTNDSTWSLYEQNTPSNAYGNRKEFLHLSRVRMNIRSGKILLDSFQLSRNNGLPVSILWTDNNGYLQKSPFSEVHIDWGNVDNKPTVKSIVTYTGTTNGSGNYIITYPVAYASTPSVNPVLVGGTNTQIIKLVSSSTTGFTINVVNRTDVIGLLPSYNNVSGANISVLIVEQ